MTELHFAIGLLFGHGFGDYAFQNNWQALSKSKNAFRCVVHCLIYTATVMLFTWTFKWQWGVLVFLSHYFIDQFSLGDNWLQLIRGRSLKWFTETKDLDCWGDKNDKPPAPGSIFPDDVIGHKNLKHRELRAGFTSLVYATVDNLFHLAIMWYGYKVLEKIL